jgi:hypothetical protein
MIAGSGLIACGSEGPEGDSESPTGLDDSGIESEGSGGDADGLREATFRFAAGATLANAEVRITNLDTALPVQTVPTNAEGGAAFTVTGADGDEIRLQIVTDSRRYEPADYLLGRSGGENTLTKHLRHSCLDIEPGLDLGFDSNFAQLSVYNECRDTLSLAEPRLRVGSLGADFELVTLMPVEIVGGISAGIELRLPATASRPSEDVLFLDAEVGSERQRYAIGLYAPR